MKEAKTRVNQIADKLPRVLNPDRSLGQIENVVELLGDPTMAGRVGRMLDDLLTQCGKGKTSLFFDHPVDVPRATQKTLAPGGPHLPPPEPDTGFALSPG